MKFCQYFVQIKENLSNIPRTIAVLIIYNINSYPSILVWEYCINNNI